MLDTTPLPDGPCVHQLNWKVLDTAIQKEQSWRSSDGDLVLEPIGGGGTDHRCVFERLDRHDPVPACVVCLTDLDTCFPDRPPAVPVLWAVVGGNSSEPPFGIRVNLDDGGV